ncbi:hypothetical protein [Paracoccus sp. (in: a-proteobacteria)]|uniref:hypothetical protein n=1 Tax=Paracoccus sp. TaxID=267 RepID=UPI002AFFD27E|nr:hypothetical protein [Paracoccus sp. (in: a-proteobacteria)]
MFKDFLLSRIVEIGKRGPVAADQQSDTDWHSEVVLKIRPRIQTSRQRSVAPSRWTTAWKMVGLRFRCAGRSFFIRSSAWGSILIQQRGDRQDQQIVLLNRIQLLGERK